MIEITGRMICAARKLADKNQTELAAASNLAKHTIAILEQYRENPINDKVRVTTLHSIIEGVARLGVMFVPRGVRFIRQDIGVRLKERT